ncbi:MAG: ATP-dependent DNA helicase RecG [Roseobacter sp.]
MSGRPEILFPLFAPLDSLRGIGPRTADHFKGLSVEFPRDLLFTLPVSVVDRRVRETVEGAALPCVVTLEVTVLSHQKPATKGRPHRVTVSDGKVPLTLIFFHARGDFWERTLPIGERRVISGLAELFDGTPQIVHPDHIIDPDQSDSLPDFEPVYPLTAGVTQKLMFKVTQSALEKVSDYDEWIDEPLRAQKKWPRFAQAVAQAHRPKGLEDVSGEALARMRLAYDEVFAHQLTLNLARTLERRKPGRRNSGDGRLQHKVRDGLPFDLTRAQHRAIAEINADLEAETRMNRLLQGDVGAGKTLVAFMALLRAIEAGGQGVLMAPTEILARQHLEAITPLANLAGVNVTLLTGRDRGRERQAKLDALQGGDIDLLIGTHSVFQADVHFKDLRLAVVDEQHRFGVRQRLELGKKGSAVDVLVMTATPIPRSLALAQFGDLDVSVLDEKPPGRKPVQTVMVSEDRLSDVVARLRAVVGEGRQCYWVCPMVEESEATDAAAAQMRFEALRADMGDAVGLVHGQMPAADKDAAMARFQRGDLRVLVATTVIEVGVNVPNATIMVIEQAEAFGLAQLHQLRGRVGRGTDQSTCVLLYRAPLSETARKRLEILRQSEDGFEIAETDLKLRGAGDLIGVAQSGLPRFRVADLEQHADLLAIAHSDARSLLERDPDLKTKRGRAVRLLLWLMQQDQAIRLISVG